MPRLVSSWSTIAAPEASSARNAWLSSGAIGPWARTSHSCGTTVCTAIAARRSSNTGASLGACGRAEARGEIARRRLVGQRRQGALEKAPLDHAVARWHCCDAVRLPGLREVAWIAERSPGVGTKDRRAEAEHRAGVED